jgi:hypothetical protein
VRDECESRVHTCSSRTHRAYIPRTRALHISRLLRLLRSHARPCATICQAHPCATLLPHVVWKRRLAIHLTLRFPILLVLTTHHVIKHGTKTCLPHMEPPPPLFQPTPQSPPLQAPPAPTRPTRPTTIPPPHFHTHKPQLDTHPPMTVLLHKT